MRRQYPPCRVGQALNTKPMRSGLMPTIQQPFTLAKYKTHTTSSVQPTCHLVYDALSLASSAHAQCHLADSWACPNNAGFGQNCR